MHTDDGDGEVALLSDRLHFERGRDVLDATLQTVARRRRQHVVLDLLTYRAPCSAHTQRRAAPRRAGTFTLTGVTRRTAAKASNVRHPPIFVSSG